MFGCIVYDSGAVAAIDTWNDNSTKANTPDNDQACHDSYEIHHTMSDQNYVCVNM